MNKFSFVYQLNISCGGVPKLPIQSANVTTKGLVGDRQAKPGIHGGIYKALSLFSLEVIQQLAAQGHPIKPGGIGENITLSGDIWEQVVPASKLHIGHKVIIKITSYATPCTSIIDSFSDGNVLHVHHKNNKRFSRLYAQVLQEGKIAAGDRVEIIND